MIWPQLTRPLNFLDCETTGLDLGRDRIIELGIIQLRPDHTEQVYSWRFDPGTCISRRVVSIHGISQEDVKGCPAFGEKALEILAVLNGSDLAGFNIVNFDVPMLWEEFHRAGIEWQSGDTNIVDVGTLFRTHESRSLSYALKFYCGREHAGAHGALCDARATLEVLSAQLERYPDLLGKDVAAVAKSCRLDPRVDLAGMVMRDADGELCYNLAGLQFDKRTNRGQKIKEDVRLAEWAILSPLPQHTKQCLLKALQSLPFTIPRRDA